MHIPKHIVAVSGLVVDSAGRVLMIESPQRGWEFPGGQVEEGENLISALQREILEETGVTVAVGALAGVYSNTRSVTVILQFLCTMTGGELRRSAESVAVEWVDRGRVLDRITQPSIRDRMRDMLDFDGDVVYRSFAYDTTEADPEYRISLDRVI